MAARRIEMRRRDFLKACAAAPLALQAASWEALDQRPNPAWYGAAKFGIFIHWGVYSVPSFAPVKVKGETPYAEWYWHSLMKGKAAGGSPTWDFHKRVYGADFQYPEFAPMFRAELFEPDHWADVFVRSGAKYVALTSKHHEGFTLWQSAEANRSWGRPWNSVDIGSRRDLVSDLSNAGRRRGLHMGVYYSLYEWFNPLWLSDRKRYVAEHMIPQFKDVVNRVKPSIIFSDGEWDMPSEDWHSPELLTWLFNESPVRDEVVVNDRWGKDTRHKHGGYYTTEYTSGLQQSGHAWEENRGMGFSYGYNRMESLKDYHTGRELLLMLIDIVSRGGNFLLDIGPTADGRIPVLMEERLTQIGDWLRLNGEAIYGTTAGKPSRQWSAGTVPKQQDSQFMSEYDIGKMVDSPAPGFARIEAFFTSKPDTIYAIVPHSNASEVVLEGLGARAGTAVTLLENGQPLQSSAVSGRLTVRVPVLPAREAHVFKVRLG